LFVSDGDPPVAVELRLPEQSRHPALQREDQLEQRGYLERPRDTQAAHPFAVVAIASAMSLDSL
jgi:hypothetical protein